MLAYSIPNYQKYQNIKKYFPCCLWASVGLFNSRGKLVHSVNLDTVKSAAEANFQRENQIWENNSNFENGIKNKDGGSSEMAKEHQAFEMGENGI